MKASFIYCVSCTLPIPSCICQYAPNITLEKPFALLYHPREYTKRSNTGRLLKKATNIHSTCWHRLDNSKLENQFKHYALLYPADNNDDINNIKHHEPQQHANIDGFLMLDATWQESQKMMRQSPWLAQLSRVSIDAPSSQYQLRRNQSDQGLSTLETLAYWLMEHNQRNYGLDLLQFLHCFQDAYLKARQAGQLK